MAKAFLISPDAQSIEEIEVSSAADIAQLIGFDTIESDRIGDGDDLLYFDEECFIRGATGRFQIDKLIPVAGKGIVLGVGADGTTPSDVGLGIDELRSRTRFE